MELSPSSAGRKRYWDRRHVPSPFEWSYYAALFWVIVASPVRFWGNHLQHYRHAVFWAVNLVRGGTQAFVLALGATFGALGAQVVAPLPPGTAFDSGNGVLLIVTTLVFGRVGFHVAALVFRIPIRLINDRNYRKLSYDTTEQLLLIAAVAEEDGTDLRRKGSVPTAYQSLPLEERYRLILDYVARHRRGLWITVPEELARRHESYRRNPVLILAVSAFIATFAISLIIDACNLLGYDDLASMIGLLRFFIFGAIAVPTSAFEAFLADNPWFRPWSEPLASAIATSIGFLILAWNPVRYAAAVAIAAYVSLSISLIPFVVPEWRLHPFVQLYGEVRYWTSTPALAWIIARLRDALVSETLLGLIGAYNRLSPYLPSALFGFSAMLWLPVAARLIGYLLTSESANLFYANRVRAPLVYYTDPPTSPAVQRFIYAKPVDTTDLPTTNGYPDAR